MIIQGIYNVMWAINCKTNLSVKIKRTIYILYNIYLMNVINQMIKVKDKYIYIGVGRKKNININTIYL